MAPCIESISHLSSYFDALADRIPVRNYIDPDEVLNLRSMKRDERIQAKATFKMQHKLSKLEKLNPDSEAFTTATLIRHGLAKAGHRHLDSHAEDCPQRTGNSSTDTEKLKERLNTKLQALRDQRNADERKASAAKAKDWKEQQRLPNKSKKRKREMVTTHDPEPTQKVHEAADVMFNNIRVQDKAPGFSGQSKKPKTVEALKLAEARKTEAAQEGAVDWTKLEKLAKGEKVLDDPRLLKKSLKRMERSKEKSREEWKTRKEAVAKKQAQRQERRQSNLQRKADKKKAKKVEKREKRFLGSGFEGRTLGSA